MSQMYQRICPQCGTALLANQRFCSNCGTTVEVVPMALQNSDPGGRASSPVPSPFSIASAPTPQPPQFQVNQQVPSVPGTPSLPGQPASFQGAAVQSQFAPPQHLQHHAYPGQP